MDVILYNPRKFKKKPGIPVPNLFNPDKTQKPIILPIGTYEPMMPNELKRYPLEVGNEIIKRWGFVRKVKPEELEDVRAEMNKKEFVCDIAECGKEFDTQKALEMHRTRGHKLSKEHQEQFNAIPVAKAKSPARKIDQTVNGVNYSPEGIPEGDVDDWYGPGEEDLSSSMRLRKPGMPGVF